MMGESTYRVYENENRLLSIIGKLIRNNRTIILLIILLISRISTFCRISLEEECKKYGSAD